LLAELHAKPRGAASVPAEFRGFSPLTPQCGDSSVGGGTGV